MILWKPEKLEKQIALSNEKNAELVFTAIEMIDEKGNIIKAKRNVKEIIDYKFLLKNTMIATSSVLIDISKVGKFEMPLIRSGQDYATWLMLMRNGRRAYGINDALTQYRRTEGSLSSKKTKNWKKCGTFKLATRGFIPLLLIGIVFGMRQMLQKSISFREINQMSKVEVLVAAMHQHDHSLLEKMHIKTDAIIGNQCDNNSVEIFKWNNHTIKYLNFAERGVGLNRNNALMRASGDYCLFADDDMIYVDDYAEKVEKAFFNIPMPTLSHLILLNRQ